jgi:hypothetical protein
MEAIMKTLIIHHAAEDALSMGVLGLLAETGDVAPGALPSAASAALPTPTPPIRLDASTCPQAKHPEWWALRLHEADAVLWCVPDRPLRADEVAALRGLAFALAFKVVRPMLAAMVPMGAGAGVAPVPHTANDAQATFAFARMLGAPLTVLRLPRETLRDRPTVAARTVADALRVLAHEGARDRANKRANIAPAVHTPFADLSLAA